MIINDELEYVRNEADVASFKALSRHLRGGTQENHKSTVGIARLRDEI
jgi:hypothetical protein